MINKTNILIVDDEPGIRDTLYYNLTDAGYNVTTAESGIDAINKIRTKKFKAILSDIVMNDGDGIMLLKELKEQSKLLPVILFTGYASIDSSIDAVNFGAYAYLKKPISIEELKKVLNKAIEKYKELRPDIVTLDITMPGMNGYDALVEIMRFDSNAVVIMVSALKYEAIILKCLEAGAKFHITKPFKTEETAFIISKILRKYYGAIYAE